MLTLRHWGSWALVRLRELSAVLTATVRLWELSVVLRSTRWVRGLQPIPRSQPRKKPRPLPLCLSLGPGGRATQSPVCSSSSQFPSHKRLSLLILFLSSLTEKDRDISQACLSKGRNCRQIELLTAWYIGHVHNDVPIAGSIPHWGLIQIPDLQPLEARYSLCLHP